MDTYADDLSEIIATLYLKETKRVAKAALISAVPSPMMKTAANPDGSPIEVFDRIRLGCITDRSQFYKDLSPFFGANRPGAQLKSHRK